MLHRLLRVLALPERHGHNMRRRLPKLAVNFAQTRILGVDAVDARARVKLILLARERKPLLRALQNRR